MTCRRCEGTRTERVGTGLLDACRDCARAAEIAWQTDESEGGNGDRTLDRTIERAVCCVFGLSRRRLHGPVRSYDVADARKVLWWLQLHHTPLGVDAIGYLCGGRNHATVRHGIDVWREYRQHEPYASWERRVRELAGLGQGETEVAG